MVSLTTILNVLNSTHAVCPPANNELIYTRCLRYVTYSLVNHLRYNASCNLRTQDECTVYVTRACGVATVKVYTRTH
jgi:hypothetical protein